MHQPPEYYIRLLLKEAEPLRVYTRPNPTVGAMLVSAGGQILAKGFHQKYGQVHAEVNCLERIERVPPDAVLYVTLEPCCHYGKTPPCTDLIIRKGVKRVVIGTVDSSSKVNGKGIKQLQENGIQVSAGIAESDCRFVNRVFFKNARYAMPYIALKTAVTADGKMALPDGTSKWITGEDARVRTHYYRSWYGAVAVGKQTYLADDPALDNRYLPDMPQPTSLVFWGSGVPLYQQRFFKSGAVSRIFIADDADLPEAQAFAKFTGATLLSYKKGKRDLKQLFFRLYDMGIDSVMIEGGAALYASVIRADCADCVHVFMAPKLLGNREAIDWSGT
ncbi:hypothetical protein CHS0354_018567 [Potamilus streckersoni]|uniref:5-amino-6-(5-phosphoribosylamino)uracil reductase n=1 Tax=Potamilus streckersoni TaxID=2493646 RepID=A0AAE0TB55_9BIVA|nr:hypothetical protein CHS0354_018567 [Potamilus streckersoni]